MAIVYHDHSIGQTNSISWHGNSAWHGTKIVHRDEHGFEAEHSALSTPIDNTECSNINKQSENDARMNSQATYILVQMVG